MKFEILFFKKLRKLTLTSGGIGKMPEGVRVSTVESGQKLMAAIKNYFKKERYAEITQVIGMHSVLINPSRMREDQNVLFRSVLTMIKNRISGSLGGNYAAWYASFPKIMDEVIGGKQIITDAGSADILASYRAAGGSFKSVDSFLFWALNDRKLGLDQIVTYIEKTAELHTVK